MSQATRKRSDTQLVGAQVGNGLRESALLVFIALAVLLLIALATYSPADPGFSHSGSGAPVHNAIGEVGAWIADLLLLVFGYPAYLFPVLVAYSGWLVFRRRPPETPVSKLAVTIRVSALLLGLAAASAIATLNITAPFHHLPLDRLAAGGVIGRAIGLSLMAGLSYIGATLLLIAVFLGCVTLSTSLSWIGVMDLIGRGVMGGLAMVRNRIASIRQAFAGRRERKARQQTVKTERVAREKRAKPKIEPVIKPIEPSPRVEKERQVPLFEPVAAGELPPLSLLDDPPAKQSGYSKSALEAMSRQVELKLKDFGVEVQVVAVNPGPVVTRFELQPAAGVKVSQISNLSKDLARALSAISVRVVEVIPGKSVVGLEIPNETRELVTLGEILRSKAYDSAAGPLTLALGKDISGNPIVAELGRMPHLLIAGTTGAGKSVAINAMILSLLYKTTAADTRLIMIDPKMLELSVYEGIPHLLAPVVTDMKEAANALRWCVAEMERRYKLMAALGVRNIASYNRKVKDAIAKGSPIKDPLVKPEDIADDDVEIPTLETLPYVVVIVDELADMMMVVGKKVEELIARLAQKARASGIHLILATQRPSVDVITGLIKANIPARIAFQVSARVDSRTILDQMGAEALLGHGDMLYLPPGTGLPQRVHGAFVSDAEVHRVVASLKSAGEPQYIDQVLEGPADSSAAIPGLESESGSEQDPLYDQAVAIVTQTRKASISGVQRRLKIGYNRAARMVEDMEAAGIVGPLETNGSREVLAPPPPED
ncbi:MAG TPA: DNA translocase FtsK 4TM domain-containing protein [Gammaproteobacteria bacterium]|nr:DNA translocase FtsK 4TM domain-containing protein [Gammaproteobacteria bacterium]